MIRDANSHFASDFHEEVSEVGRGGGQDHLVGGERGAPAARQRHVREVLSAKYVSRQPESRYCAYLIGLPFLEDLTNFE